MRIAAIAPTPYFSDRGCHIRIYGMALAASHAGHSPEIFTYHIGRDHGRFPVHRIRGLRGYDYTGPGPKWRKILLDRQLAALLKRNAREFDIAHAHLHEGGWIARKLGIPYVLDLQGILVEELHQHGFVGARGPRRWFWRQVEKSILRAEAIITSSRSLARRLDEEYSVVATPVEDGVDTRTFRPVERDKELVARYGLAGKRVLGYLGGLGPGKGIQTMIAAFSEIEDRNTVLLIGGYPWVDWVRGLADEFDVADRVVTAGRVSYESAPAFISLMDVAIAPKVESGEGGQGKVLSYAACGVPVVLHDTNENRRLLGGNGFFFGNDMTRSIRKALDDTKAPAVGRRAMEHVRRHHSWKARSKKLDKIYSRLV